MKRLFQVTLVAILLFNVSSCSQGKSKTQADIRSNDTLVVVDLPDDLGNIIPKYKMMERLKLSGDFNGDGRIDTIYESYISAHTGAETYKIMDSTDWEFNIRLIIRNKPISRFYTNIKGVDTFIVTKEPQLQGIWLLENLGDIYGDKGDEIGYVINWADYSNTNSYHIITLLNGKWKELYHFDINEVVNYQSENLFDSTSIIKPLEHNKIRHKYFDIHAEISDTVVTLKLK